MGAGIPKLSATDNVVSPQNQHDLAQLSNSMTNKPNQASDNVSNVLKKEFTGSTNADMP